MSKREAFLLRTDPKVLDALRRWAADDLRSVNAQLDFLLRSALRQAGRWTPDGATPTPATPRDEKRERDTSSKKQS